MAYNRINSSIGFRPVYIPPSERFINRTSTPPISRASSDLIQPRHRNLVLQEAHDTFTRDNAFTTAASPVLARELMRSPKAIELARLAGGITTSSIFQPSNYEKDEKEKEKEREPEVAFITAA